MRILITGASGFIGSHLGKRLSAGHEVLGTVFRSPKKLPFHSERLDLTGEFAVASLLQEFKPQVIVHAAALSRVIGCEERPADAVAVNVTATARLLRWAETLHAKLIFLSSDQVYSGVKGGYRESDAPDPVSVYGHTKLEAEQRVLASTARTLVIRSNSVVGPSLGWGESFSDMVLNRLRAGRSIELFEDQYRSPIHIRSLLDVLESACVLDFSGLVHVGGPRRHSRLDVGYAVARAYGLSCDPITVSRFREHPQAAIMTADTSYDISRLKQLMPFVRLRRLDDELLADANAAEAKS